MIGFRLKPPQHLFATENDSREAARFGMWLFLSSLAMLFAGTILAAVVMRLEIDPWPTDLPPLPLVLWGSTVLLLISSATMQRSLANIRQANGEGAARMLLCTCILGFLFLAIQSWCWIDWLRLTLDKWPEGDPHRFALAGFYVLTGLHAVHVVGGIIPMFIITRRAFKQRYTSKEHRGIQMITMYWHFLDVVWIILFMTLIAIL